MNTERTSERGATALTIALVMVLIMGIAAIVIDGGLGFNERRQAQGAVDFGSLAALQTAISCPAPCTTGEAANQGAAEAIAVVQQNLPDRTLLWDPTNCADPSRPAEYTVVASLTPCVSFTENLDKARVNLPDDAIETSFGRLLGLDNLTIAAVAEAEATIRLSTRIIPFTPTGTSGPEVCLFSNQAPQTIEPCDGAASGFYGYLDVALYGKNDLGTPSTCINGDTNKRVAINLAKGGDHSFVTYDPGPPDPVINDHDACPNTNEDINELRVETGSPTGGITDGLIDGVSGSINGAPITSSPGRLECDLGGESSQCVSVRGESLDHTGLWEYLVSGSCPSNPTTHDEMKTCLQSGTAEFTAAIADHPRFAAVPLLWPNPGDTAAPTGPGDYKIKEFVAVWIDTLYFDCSANDCDTVHSPGEDFNGASSGVGAPAGCPPVLDATKNCGWSDTSGPDAVEGMLAFTIDSSMLPASIVDTFPATETTRTYALFK